MKEHRFAKEFFEFLTSSPTPYHAVSSMADRFHKQGFRRLSEQETWKLQRGSRSFVVRDDGAIVAFCLSSEAEVKEGFRILGAHTDSPCLQIKPLPDVNTLKYQQLGVEVYGGALLNPWFDRDLSIAGRVCCQTNDGGLRVYLANFQRPILSIPSLAIHFDREANKNRSINAQQNITPLFSQVINNQVPDFKTILKKQIEEEHRTKDIAEVLGFDMFCYDTQPPEFLGLNKEFISASRLDNLLSCFVGTIAMIEKNQKGNSIFICNNHEEIGSTSATGAMGSLPTAIIERIVPDVLDRRICLSRSFFISMDNAHAVHPNYMDKSDANHQILLNRGPVIKINANQRYASNSFSEAVFQLLAKEINVETQEFVMRNDMACGSTIGPLIASQLGIRTVDVGAPTLAMHSIRELTGSLDPYLLYQTIKHFLCRDHLPGDAGQ